MRPLTELLLVRVEGLGADLAAAGCYVSVDQKLYDVITPLHGDTDNAVELPEEGTLRLIFKDMADQDTALASVSLPISLLPEAGCCWLPLFTNIDNDFIDMIEGEITPPKILVSTDSFCTNLSEIPECSRSYFEESQELSLGMLDATDRRQITARLMLNSSRDDMAPSDETAIGHARTSTSSLTESAGACSEPKTSLPAWSLHGSLSGEDVALASQQTEELQGKVRKLEVINQEFELQVKAWMDKALMEAGLRASADKQVTEMQQDFKLSLLRWEDHTQRLVQDLEVAMSQRDSFKRGLEGEEVKAKVAEMKASDYQKLYEAEAATVVRLEARLAWQRLGTECGQFDSVTAEHRAWHDELQHLQTELDQTRSRLFAAQAEADRLAKENESLLTEKLQHEYTEEAGQELLEYVNSLHIGLSVANGRLATADVEVKAFRRNKATVVSVEGPLQILNPVLAYIDSQKRLIENSRQAESRPKRLIGHRRTRSSDFCDQFLSPSENDMVLNLSDVQMNSSLAINGSYSCKETAKSRDVSPITLAKGKQTTQLRVPFKEKNLKKAGKGRLPFK
jgi:hypothetical protein